MSESKRGLSRRRLLITGAGVIGTAGLAACGATPTPQIVKEVVTSVVEKEVTKIVEGTPQIVKETVVVEQTVAVEVTAAAGPAEVRIACYTISDSWNKTVEGVYAAFMEKNPNIKVKNEWRPGDNYWTKIQTEFAGGTAPDVTVNQMDWVIPGAARGMFLDIKPFIERDKFDMTQFYYPMSLEWEWQGGLYGGLLYAGGQALYINKDMLKKAGLEMPKADWTWDDFLTYAKAMTNEADGTFGVVGANGAPPYWSCAFIEENGGSVLNAEYNKCTLTEAPAVEAVQWIADLMFKHKVMPSPTTEFGGVDPFLTGKVGMSFSGTWSEAGIRDAKLFDWDFAHMPVHPQTKKRAVQLGSNAWSIISNTQHRDESWKLVEYLMGPDGQKGMMTLGIPGIQSVVDSPEYKAKHAPQDISVLVSDFGTSGHDYYPTADCGEWWGALGQEWNAIWSGEAQVEPALANICTALDGIFAKRPPIYEKVKPTAAA
jgi:multiple sugar transport system substrate-binding protein